MEPPGSSTKEGTERHRGLATASLVVQERERHRLAADIHDDSIQTLVMCAMRLHTLRASTGEPVLREAMAELERSLLGVVARLRNLMFELDPVGLDQHGLAAAIRTTLRGACVEHGMSLQVRDRLPPSVPHDVAREMYRMVREAVINAIKHSEGHVVTVTLSGDAQSTWATIRDRGRGFDVERTMRQLRPGHAGLLSLQERAAIADGTVSITSKQGAGTTVTICVPTAHRLEEPARELRGRRSPRSR